MTETKEKSLSEQETEHGLPAEGENTTAIADISRDGEAEQQISEEEVKRLHQQNVASYNKVIAVSKGLISNIHGKGGKKKR